MLSMVLMRFLNLQTMSRCFILQYTILSPSMETDDKRWLLARSMTDARYYRIVHEDD